VDRAIDVHVSRIRTAIEDDPKHPRFVRTIRGAGYVFHPGPAATEDSP
jgi:DNA-binding response OmpR family regulator